MLVPLRSCSLALVALVLAACGSTTAPPKVAASLGEDHELFAVDWPTSMRADLEANARSGLAVVALQPNGAVRVLPTCTIDARYAAMEVTPKEDLLRLETRDEVKATFPFAALSMMNKVGMQGSDESVLDVAVVTRTVARAPALPFSRAEEVGPTGWV